MPRRNRVDPFGDLHAVAARGAFTGNRGCLVDDDRRLVRHHRGQLWITCVTSFRGWKSPLDQPRHWTPLFFLDDAVALAAGHRPCGLCRRTDYLAYQSGVTIGLGRGDRVPAAELNRMLAKERLHCGRGLDRSEDRILGRLPIDQLPDGTVTVSEGTPLLLYGEELWRFGFEGWGDPRPRPAASKVSVLTPPTSVLALSHGFVPSIHPSVAKRH